jgi:hypothetical protein
VEDNQLITFPESQVEVRTNVISAHVSCLRAESIVGKRRTVCCFAEGNLILASVAHLVGKFHVVVDCLVNLFSACKLCRPFAEKTVLTALMP